MINVIANQTLYSDTKRTRQSITKSERPRDKTPCGENGSGVVEVTQQIALKRRGVETRIAVQDGPALAARIDQGLIDMIAKAHLAVNALTDGIGRGFPEVAAVVEIDASDLSRILPLAFLSPKLMEAILTGRQSPDLTLRKLTRGIELPIDWQEQNA